MYRAWGSVRPSARPSVSDKEPWGGLCIALLPFAKGRKTQLFYSPPPRAAKTVEFRERSKHADLASCLISVAVRCNGIC